jgi:hypothetical protein
MASASRTEAACLTAALEPKSLAYQTGYLEGAIRTAIIQLEYSPNLARVTLEKALKELDA